MVGAGWPKGEVLLGSKAAGSARLAWAKGLCCCWRGGSEGDSWGLRKPLFPLYESKELLFAVVKGC